MHRTRDIAVFVTLVVCVLAPQAMAKESIGALTVCGSNECKTVDDPALVAPIVTGVGQTRSPQPVPAAYLTLVPQVKGEWRTSWPRYVYVPAAQVVRMTGEREGDVAWSPVEDWALSAYEQASRGLAPFEEPPSWARVIPNAEDNGSTRLRWPAIAVAAIALMTMALLAGGVLRSRGLRPRVPRPRSVTR
jgi:hypothetical protein